MEKKVNKRSINQIFITLVISDIISVRRKALEELQEEFQDTANAEGTNRNYESRRKRYREFCDFSKIRQFPVTEFKITKFATFLSDILKTVESIKAYCTTICDDNELKGYRPVRRGLMYYRTISGIRHKLRHKVKRAAPMTEELLLKIETVVNVTDDKELVVWTCMLTGFNLVLRKSNLVPLKRVHDTVHNLSRSDVRYTDGVMVFVIDWSKTNQFGLDIQTSPLIANKYSPICPVRWLLYMMKTIHAGPHDNLFSIRSKRGITPITYRDLMSHMRKWLDMIGTDSSRFSSHSLRRGAATACHQKKISGMEIQELGAWRSDCYKRYIEIDMAAKVRTCYKFNQKD